VRADTSELEACVEPAHTGGRGHFDQLSDDEVSELLRVTGQSLADQRPGAALWYGGWTAFNVANVAVGAFKVVNVSTQLARDTWLMSTIGASLFLLGAAVMPLPSLYAHLRMKRSPEASASERREKLRRGLILLERTARAEDRNSNLLAHLGGLAYALFSTLYIYFHNPHADPQDRIITGVQFGASVVGSEATLWSVPRKARRDLASLKQRACGVEAPKAAAATPLRALTLATSPAYLGLRLSF
jgi:hypothetical protein